MIPLELYKKSKEQKLSATEAKWIEDTLKKYPYFSMLHFINAKIAHHENKSEAKELASLASIYSIDRKKTANYIQQSLKTVFKPSTEILSETQPTPKNLVKETSQRELNPSGPRVGMIDWKFQTVIQIRVQMYLHLKKLLLQEIETYKNPKPKQETNVNPLSLNLAENILNLLNINLMDLASNPNIKPSFSISQPEKTSPSSKETEQNIKGDTKTDQFAEKLAKLKEANEELKRLKKITSESMKRFVEPNFDKRTYITELPDDVFQARLKEQKEKTLLEKSNATIAEKKENVQENPPSQQNTQIINTITNITNEKQETSKPQENIPYSEEKKQIIPQNITSDSMKRFKPLTFEENDTEVINKKTSENQVITKYDTPTHDTQEIKLETHDVKSKEKQIQNTTENKTEPIPKNISSESFKRFIPLDIDMPSELLKKAPSPNKISNQLEKEDIKEKTSLEKNISSDTFKRFVPPEFDVKPESLKTKNLEKTEKEIVIPNVTQKDTKETSTEIPNQPTIVQETQETKNEKKELSGSSDSLKRFVEPDFDNAVKSPKKEDTSLSRFVKPDFDEHSKKSFKTSETIIEVQSTKYVIELIVKKDKIHHYFKKDIVSKIIEVNPEISETKKVVKSTAIPTEKVEQPTEIVTEKVEQPTEIVTKKVEQPAEIVTGKVEQPSEIVTEKVEQPAEIVTEKVEEINEIQKPYHEMINIEKIENKIAGHKKKAEIIGKKTQISSDITLKSLQNKFLQSIIKSKAEKNENTQKTIPLVKKSSKDIDDILEKIKQLENRFSVLNQVESKNEGFQVLENENEETQDLSEEIITETMAKIFLIQGDVLKSIKIYKKLIEKNPTKREYYEQKIKEIESK